MRSKLQSFSFFAVRRFAPAVCLLAFSWVCASATPVTFTAEDLGAGPGGPDPSSTAAATSFTTAAGALGTVSTLTFESDSVGSFISLAAAPGVTITGTNASGGDAAILNVPNFPAAPSLDGFNTTSGGANYLEVAGGTVTFTFADPTQFFGAYLTGIQAAAFFQDTLTFSDGTSVTIDVPGTGTTSSLGATDFVGFTDAGKSISSVTINAGVPATGFDDIGVDNVEYQSQVVAATPEPGSILLVFSGLASLGMRYRRFGANRA